MSLMRPAAFLALTLLAGAAKPPPLPECESARPHIALTAEPSGELPEVCISPGLTTSFLFDSPLPPSAVELRARDRFLDVALGERTLSLVPSDDLKPGERLEMTLRFADGALPRSATLVLVGHPAWAARQVAVFRQPRTVEDYQQEALERRAEARQCQEEKRQRAEQRESGGLTGLIALECIEGSNGIASLASQENLTANPGNTLVARFLYTYRCKNRVAVAVVLEKPGTESWTAVEAALISATGESLPVLPVWQRAPSLKYPREELIVVEAEAKRTQALGPYSLRLWDAGGQRTLTFGNILFP